MKGFFAWLTSGAYDETPRSGQVSQALLRRNDALANELLELDRMRSDPGRYPPEQLQERRRRVALAVKDAIEGGIARHGVGKLGLSLKDIREAEEELKAAGVEDWRIRIRL